MKFVLQAFLASAVAGPVAVSLDQSFTLASGQAATTKGLVLTFVKVDDDSRCPVGAMCASAGSVSVNVRVVAAGASAREVTLAFGHPAMSPSVEAGGLTVELLDVARSGGDASFVIRAVRPPPRPGSVLEHVLKGRPVQVVLDARSGDSDDRRTPLGTIKTGETYAVQWDPRQRRWSATGYNKGTRSVGTYEYPNGDPARRELCIWGRVFTYDDKGVVLDTDLGPVGRVVVAPPASSRPPPGR